MDEIIKNIRHLYDTYGDKIKTDKHLILLYLQKIDGCSVNKEGISTIDFLEKSTDMKDILSGIRLYKILRARRD